MRWASGEHGTVVSRIDIVRAIGRGEPFQTLPFVRPGGEILLRLDSWPKVQRGFAAIDAVESLGLDPADGYAAFLEKPAPRERLEAALHALVARARAAAEPVGSAPRPADL